MRHAYLSLCHALDRMARVTVMALVAAMTAIVLLGVFFRYVLGHALPWTDEVSRYLMIWMGFLGSGVALREGSHVAMTIFLDMASPSLRRKMLLLIRCLSLGFLLSVIWAGGILVVSIRSQVSAVLRISMTWAYLAIPIGCLLIAFEMIALMMIDPEGRGYSAVLEEAANPEKGS